MSAIDPITGLPTLPDGQWWEVREIPYHWNSFYLIIAKNVDVASRVSCRTRRAWWNAWLMPDKVTEVPASTEVKTVAEKPIYESAGITLTTTAQPEPELAKKLTPDLILATAQALLDEVEDSRATKALLGAYPPKKLVTE